MRTRNPPRFADDDRAFPIRVKFVVPPVGMSAHETPGVTLDGWLAEHLGAPMWTWGPADSNACPQATAYYFRRLEDAERFVAAFPTLELADGVARE